jgi:aspartate/methionine/tyrosine aminotransferase
VSTDKKRFAPASRMEGINPFRVMTVLERAKKLEQQGRSIIHLEVGEPDFTTVEPVIAAGRRALDHGFTHYTPAAGLPELRQRISAHYADTYGVCVDPARILVTVGASGALVLLSQLLLNPGDGVLMTDPGYPCNRNFVRLAGGRAQLIPVNPATDYQLTPALLDQHYTSNSKGVWLASPGNPSGTVADAQSLQAISDWAEQHACHLLVDEIYHGLDYVGGLSTALQASQDNLVVNSFSKYFGMTGWRLGWLVVPDALVEAANILAQNLFIAAPTLSQYAALRAFDADVKILLDQRRQEFQQRRDFLCAALTDLGFKVPTTQGAFYIYADISEVLARLAAVGTDAAIMDSERFCHELLEQQGVAITPGTDFGDYQAATHVRFAFTTRIENLQLAVERLRVFLQI